MTKRTDESNEPESVVGREGQIIRVGDHVQYRSSMISAGDTKGRKVWRVTFIGRDWACNGKLGVHTQNIQNRLERLYWVEPHNLILADSQPPDKIKPR